MELFKYKKPIPLMAKAKIFFTISIVAVLASYVLIFTKGFNLGIDFAGGTVVQVKYEGKAPIDKVREAIKSSKIFEGASVNYFGSDDEIVIKVRTSSKQLGTDIGDEARKLLAPTGKFEVRRVDMVGPKVGNELREKGIMALVLAIAGILVYVSFRFEWRFAIASVIALVHDISIAMGAIVLFNIEVNLDILAALLTILGYSLNDTIIVFDRIREGLVTVKSSKLADVIDESVTRTLSRTTLTSLTTFFVVLTLFLMGGEIIHGFSFTLLVGIIVGTYSSIFIASPLLMAMNFNVEKYRKKLAEKKKREEEKARLRSMYEQGTV
ncbi:MAG: protein translocase subunit SecF [Hydrogenimonas sp.]|nr:protein translocase subunit SecF [Hydrogenimonas sp.]